MAACGDIYDGALLGRWRGKWRTNRLPPRAKSWLAVFAYDRLGSPRRLERLDIGTESRVFRFGKEGLMDLKKAAAFLILVLLSTSVFAITNAQFFTWASAAYPQYFSGQPTAGVTPTYDYRHYPASNNYLAIDGVGDVHVYGPISGNSPLRVENLSWFAPDVSAWVSTQPADVMTGKLLIRAWNPDGTEAGIDGFVSYTRYLTSKWSMYSNYGVFPLGKPPASSQIGSDISTVNVGGISYIAMSVPTNQPLYFTALWRAPTIGTVFMRADNGGAGYMLPSKSNQKLELPYDFAIAEYQQAQRLLPSTPLSTEAQSLLTQAAAAIDAAKGASTSSARAVAAYKALSYVMPLKERLVLDASNKSILATGQRTDFDLNYEGFGSWRDVKHLPGYTSAKDAGFRSVLTNVDWPVISPAKGVYDFTSLDDQIDQALKLGFKVALNVNRNPPSQAAWVRNLSFDELKPLFYENARAVVARYGSRVSLYYAAAELELERSGLSLEQVAELVKQSLAGARAASPNTPFGIYVSASAYVPYQMNVSPNPTYLSGFDLISHLAKNNIKYDFLGLQMQYGTTFAPIDLQRFQEVLQDVYNVAKVPIYMGETGYSSKAEDYGVAAPFYWHDGLTQQAQYEWADGTLRTLYAMPFVKGYYWVHLDPDDNDYGSDYLSTLIGTGLVKPDGTVKKVQKAFKDFTSQMQSLPVSTKAAR